MDESLPQIPYTPAWPGDPVPGSLPDLFARYEPPTGHDEVLVRPGEPRAHWQRFLLSLNRLGADELAQRWEQACQLVREHGIAYSPFGDAPDRLRPWELDALPLLLPESEWRTIAQGLMQRARLWEAVLNDLYGPQRLIAAGIVPAEVIFRHPGFRYAYHGPRPSGHRFLVQCSADLARGIDGNWYVLADRTEAPSGAGFALENRVVTSRMLPTIFRQSNVRRLASYFMAWQRTLQQMAPRHRENPRIVLLSQGTDNASYFEDAYLARYLGYTLVEGDDLTIRNGEVMLKTLGGLLPVDVIIRRPNSEACDPLELVAHSTLGTAGLLQSARGGHVGVANSLGSGLVESPVFLAFLPQMCHFLLGETLALPQIATSWCGDATSRSYVLERLDEFLIQPAYRQRGENAHIVQRLRTMTRRQISELLAQDPAAYVAQPRPMHSSIPTYRDGELRPAYVTLRAFMVATDQGYEVMDGALARTSATCESMDVSLLLGEGSKDTWILSSDPVEPVTLLPPRGEALRLARSRADLPSRVADNLYWLGRHIERVDSAARLLRTVTLRVTSESAAVRCPELPYLLRCLAEQGQIEPGFAVDGMREHMPAIEQILPILVFDHEQPGSLRSILTHTYRIASRVRDRISVDSWRIVSTTDHDFRWSAEDTMDLSGLLHHTNQLIMDLAAFGGTVTESMTRTHAYRFLELGRRLERALQILALVGNTVIDVVNVPSELLEAILEIADSRMTYRSRYLANLQLAPVLDLVLTDDTNPRSLAYQLNAIQEHVSALPMLATIPGFSAEQRLAMTILHTIRMVDIESVCDSFQLGDQGPLRGLIGDLSRQIPQLSQLVTLRYLAHAGPSQQLAELVPR